MDLGFFEPVEQVVEEQRTEPILMDQEEVVVQVIESLSEKEYQRMIKQKNHVDLIYEFLFDNASFLEFQGYLDHLMKLKLTKKVLISVVTLTNERFKNACLDWSIFENVGSVIDQIIELFVTDLELIEKRQLLIFIMNAFQSLDNTLIRKQLTKYISIGIWTQLTDSKREFELNRSPDRLKNWNKYLKKPKSELEISFFTKSISFFFELLDSIENVERESLLYCERFVEFMIDMEAQLPTRRYFHALFQDHQVIAYCKHSKLFQLLKDTDSLFHRLINTLEFYESFEIDDITGQPISYQEARQLKHDRLCHIQKVAFKEFPEMDDFIYASAGSLENSKSLRHHLEKLSVERLVEFANAIAVRTEPILMEKGPVHDHEFLLECIVYDLRKHSSQLEMIKQLPLYPDEKIMFDDIRVPPNKTFTNSHCQPLPKLNIQFLTLHDYLLRNFQLYQIESTFAIRQDVEDAIVRLNPRYNPDFVSTFDKTIFGGWARMAVPLNQIQIDKVGEPRLAELIPSFVKADITYSLDRYKQSIRNEWDQIKQHDTLFLVSLQMLPDFTVTDHVDSRTVADLPGPEFKKKYGITHIRGCEVSELLDDAGDVIFDFSRAAEPDANGEAKLGSHQRTIRVLLDPNQYYTDEQNTSDIYDIYGSFNVIVRRNASQNNFKSVLESIRDLMQSELVVPDWLTETLLGYGDRSAAHYSKMEEPTQTIDFGYTFLNWDHLVASFPEKTVVPVKEKKSPTLIPPFVVTFPKSEFEMLQDDNEEEENGKRKAKQGQDAIMVKSYRPDDLEKQKVNKIKFTPMQVEAIRSGSSKGLTLIVGPPGTGKTDVAVQTITNIYNQDPNSHMLLITRSNQALNHLFQKISNTNINPQHLLRLGHGHEDLDSGEVWSKGGRILSFMDKRIEVLKQVEKLAASLGYPVDHAYSCEAAEYFFTTHIEPLWKQFKQEYIDIDQPSKQDLVAKFPFSKFMKTVKSELFGKAKVVEEVLHLVHSFYGYIEKLFAEVGRVRPFELLRTNKERANYLLVKEARIIAMTSTHASIKRRELVRMGFKYDTVIIEEAGQMLEVETFIPLLLQTHDTDLNRSPLHRVVLIGDHHQLPPVIQNQAVAKYGKMEQSLFARLVRLGVPTINLDYQGRCRSSIADLFRWNYQDLKDLELPQEFQFANPGFAYDFQAIDVPDYKGVGESVPRPHFIQNLGEAEFVVATYMYMRLIGYPAEKIAILTTYNGQKELLVDVMNRRCARNPLFGVCTISTVDQYQGQQSDFILLSLVRTKTVGHVRDIRRLIVALSRARLGLYLFCRKSVFENCMDLKPAFDQIFARPTLLSIVQGEDYETRRKVDGKVKEKRFGDCIELGTFVQELSSKAVEQLANK